MRAEARQPKGASTGGQFTTRARTETSETVGASLYFHVAPDDARDSIAVHGLDHDRGESAYAETSLGYPSGNYLFSDPDAAAEYASIRAEEERDEYGPEARGYDVYEVRLGDENVNPDPFRDDASGLGVSAVYVETPVPATAVRPIT